MTENMDALTQVLIDELGFTPYEARAYVTILINGPLSPKGLNQKSGIPRPRTYDVLNGLVGKGLLLEQPGKPSLYEAVDPKMGLKKLMESIEKKVENEIRTAWKAVETLSMTLSKHYDQGQHRHKEVEEVWVTRRDYAMIAKYSETIRSVEDGFVIVTALSTPPETEILDAIRSALTKKKNVRAIRPINSEWSTKELEKYKTLIDLGAQIQHLNYKGLTFAIFDDALVVLWLPPHPSQTTIWIHLPELAEVLMSRFEQLWQSTEPALPKIKTLLKQKERSK